MKAQAYTSSFWLRNCKKPICSQARLQLSSLFRLLLSFLQKVASTMHTELHFHEMKEWGKASHCHLLGAICLFLATNPPGRAKLGFISIALSWWLLCLFSLQTSKNIHFCSNNQIQLKRNWNEVTWLSSKCSFYQSALHFKSEVM